MRAGLALESVPLLAQTLKEALLQNLGVSPTANTFVSGVAPKWIHKAIIPATYGYRGRHLLQRGESDHRSIDAMSDPKLRRE